MKNWEAVGTAFSYKSICDGTPDMTIGIRKRMGGDADKVAVDEVVRTPWPRKI